MKACGISLYRIALPMVVCAVGGGGGAVRARGKHPGTGEPARGSAERRHPRPPHGQRRDQPPMGGRLPRRDLSLQLHRSRRRGGCSACRSTSSRRAWSGSRAARSRSGPRPCRPQGPVWRLEEGWTRAFSTTGAAEAFSAFQTADRTLDSMSAFVTEAPDARFMGYAQLKTYTERLRGRRVRRARAGRGAGGQGRLPLRDHHHDADGGAVRGADRPRRRDGGPRDRDRTRPHLLDHDQRLRGDGHRRAGDAARSQPGRRTCCSARRRSICCSPSGPDRARSPRERHDRRSRTPRSIPAPCSSCPRRTAGS